MYGEQQPSLFVNANSVGASRNNVSNAGHVNGHVSNPFVQDARGQATQDHVRGVSGRLPTDVSETFFSEANVHYLHVELQRRVRDACGWIIDRQSDPQLRNVMLTVYTGNFSPTTWGVARRVECLNERVLLSCVGQVLDGIALHLSYLRDSVLPQTVPEPLPVTTSTRGMALQFYP